MVGSSYNRRFIYITASEFTYLTYNLISHTAGTRSRISQSTKHRKWPGRSSKQISSKVEFSVLMVLELLAGNVSSCSSHLILAHIITITTWREKTPLSSWLYLGLTTSGFGRVLRQKVVCQTPPYGKIVTSKSTLSSCLNSLNLPKPTPLSGRAMLVPYVLTGDDVFALTRLSKAQRIFNYKLSRMRKISENCFGIIANRWKVFRALILLPPDKVFDLIW